MKTTTIVLIIACSIAFVSAFPLETSALLERQDGSGQGQGAPQGQVSGQGQVAQGTEQGQGASVQDCEHAGAEQAQSAPCKAYRLEVRCLAVKLPAACTEEDLAAALATACVAGELPETCSLKDLQALTASCVAASLPNTHTCTAANLKLYAEYLAAKEAYRIAKADYYIARDKLTNFMFDDFREDADTMVLGQMTSNEWGGATSVEINR
jgi:hypothetical protein